MTEAEHTSLVVAKVESAVCFLASPATRPYKIPRILSAPGGKSSPSEESKALDTISTLLIQEIPNRGISSPPPGMFCHLDSTRGRALRSHISLDPIFFCSCNWRSKASEVITRHLSAAGALSSGRHQPPPCGNPAALLR